MHLLLVRVMRDARPFLLVAFSTAFAGYFFIYLNVSRSSIVFSLFAFVEFLHQLPVVPR